MGNIGRTISRNVLSTNFLPQSDQQVLKSVDENFLPCNFK